MGIIKVLKFIYQHPLNKKRKWESVWLFFVWQIKQRVNPSPVIYTFGGKAKLIIAKGMTGATGNLYTGLHEFNDMAFVLHLLREKDLFVDIGANVGSYTILASAVQHARTISIEPVTQTFSDLNKNIELNNIRSLVISLNIALGNEKGEIKFTKNQDTINHALAKDENLSEAEYVTVPVDTLDNLLQHEQPLLLKIDVEGFETLVMKGADKLMKSGFPKAVIMEINDSIFRYGFDKDALHDEMLRYGFNPYHYDPFTRQLTLLQTYSDHNTIYVRDFDFINTRLIESASHTINGISF